MWLLFTDAQSKELHVPVLLNLMIFHTHIFQFQCCCGLAKRRGTNRLTRQFLHSARDCQDSKDQHNRGWSIHHIHAHGGEGGFTPTLGSRKMLLVSDFWKINKKFWCKSFVLDTNFKFFWRRCVWDRKRGIYSSLSIFKSFKLSNFRHWYLVGNFPDLSPPEGLTLHTYDPSPWLISFVDSYP